MCLLFLLLGMGHGFWAWVMAIRGISFVYVQNMCVCETVSDRFSISEFPTDKAINKESDSSS